MTTAWDRCCSSGIGTVQSRWLCVGVIYDGSRNRVACAARHPGWARPDAVDGLLEAVRVANGQLGGASAVVAVAALPLEIDADDLG